MLFWNFIRPSRWHFLRGTLITNRRTHFGLGCIFGLLTYSTNIIILNRYLKRDCWTQLVHLNLFEYFLKYFAIIKIFPYLSCHVYGLKFRNHRFSVKHLSRVWMGIDITEWTKMTIAQKMNSRPILIWFYSTAAFLQVNWYKDMIGIYF